MDKFVEYRNREIRHPIRHLYHNHDFYELYTYLGSEAKYFFYINDSLYNLSAGDVVIVRPGVSHGSFKRSSGTFARLNLRLDTSTVELTKSYSPAVYQFLTSGSCVVHPQGEDAESYRRLVASLIEMEKSFAEEEALPHLAQVLQMLPILARAPSATENPTPSNDLIWRVVDYVEKNYATIHSIADIAREFSYSPNYLATVFRQQMNVSLHDFLLHRRLYVSTVKLRAGMSVTECAMECGFSSPSHFINCFKKEYNTSPRAWRADNIVEK